MRYEMRQFRSFIGADWQAALSYGAGAFAWTHDEDQKHLNILVPYESTTHKIAIPVREHGDQHEEPVDGQIRWLWDGDTDSPTLPVSVTVSGLMSFYVTQGRLIVH